MTKSYLLFFIIISSGIMGVKLLQSDKQKHVGNQHKSPVMYNIENKNHPGPDSNYTMYCGGCHGEKMDAFVDRNWKHGNTKEDLFKAIKQGYPDEGMPSFDTAFSDDEIYALVNYIQTGIQNVNQYKFQDAPISNIFETEAGTIRLDTVLSGLDVPWGMAFLPGGEMLVTERGGTLYRVKDGNKTIINGVPEVLAEGQGGLLDVALHPDFINNKVIYLSYSLSKKEDNDVLSTTAVTRAVLDGNMISDKKIIFEALPYSKTRHHYGSRLQFDKEGYLYISIGDRGNEKENPQSLERFPGKVHRIQDDGAIPKDNPFTSISGAVASIYTFGHRNIQGMTIHPETGHIWTNEHGPRGGDEINILRKASNYGWPVITYGINYNGTIITSISEKEGLEQPLIYWLPSIAPSGFAFVSGDKYPGWEGDALVGSLRFKYLNRCKISEGKISHQEMLFKNIGRVRDVRLAPDGYIYMAVEQPGIIFKVVPVKE